MIITNKKNSVVGEITPFEIQESQLHHKSWNIHEDLNPVMHEKFVQYDLMKRLCFKKKKKNSIPEPCLRGLIVSTYSSYSFVICFNMHFFVPSSSDMGDVK